LDKAKLFYERVEEKLHQTTKKEIKGRVSWASADNSRVDPFNNAMCLYVKQQSRAYNSKQDEAATDKVEWAAVTFEQICHFFPLVQLRCGTPDIRVNTGDL
jgi:hypothetical protein